MSMEVSSLTRNTLAKMFAEGKRFDGRKLEDFRDIQVDGEVSNKAEGSIRLKVGKTDVVVGVKLSTGEPYADSADKGNLIVSGDLLPLASPRFEQGPPGFAAIELPRLVDRLLRGAEIIDFEKLCIEKGKKVWNVFIDIYPINDDGNLVDVATMGAVIALHNTVMPGLNENGHADYKHRTKEKLPLNDAIPLSFTFYKFGDSLILDPTREEEESCETKVNWGISKLGGEYVINSCQKGFETPVTQKEVEKMMEIIPDAYEKVMKKLKSHLK